MPFYFYHKERLVRQIAQLSELRYRDMQSIEAFTAYWDEGANGQVTPPEGSEAFTIQLGERWKGIDRYLWLCAEVQLPQTLIGQDVIGVFDFGTTNFGGMGFESLLYVNGQSYQAVDQNHKEVFLPLEQLGCCLKLQFRAWTGLEDGRMAELEHTIREARIGRLDRSTDELYFMTKNIMETIDELPDNDPNKTWLMNQMVKAFNMVDFSVPGSEEFYISAQTANDFLNELLQGQDRMQTALSIIGHTHIDTAWLWRLTHTREKCARSFSTVNRLMERYDDYQFLQTQAQLYDYLKTDYPDIYAHIQKRVAEGRWEPGGSMWVECDCNLTSGESIVRQILYGKRFFEQEFGVDNDYLWLPDVFGYSAALPQILKQAEVDTFVTTKISWNDTNKLPYDTFLWRGLDGTEVTAHFITSPEHSSNRYYTYNGIIDPYMLRGTWGAYANKDLNTDLLLAYGYGDGGGGVNRDMLENLRCLKKMPGMPEVRVEHASDYFHRLNDTLRENPRDGYLPVWDGELYLEFHRGTYTSQAYSKRKNRELEFLARNTELTAALAMLQTGAEYPQEIIFDAWKIIMRHQFHDIIPGSSIHEVYEDSREEYAEAEALLLGALNQSAKSFVEDKDGCFTVWNTLNWKRDVLVLLPEGTGALQMPDGKPVCCVMTKAGVCTLIPGVEPMSMVTLVPAAGSIPSGIVETGNNAETEHYRVEWNENGHLISLYDKEAGRELIPAGETANLLQVFEDKPRQFDAWELESTFENKQELVSALESCVCEKNALGVFVTFCWTYRRSRVEQTMKLYHHSKRIDFETTVDWQEREKIMKAAFPLNIRSTEARYDIQFGNVKRPITRNTSWEAAKYEVVAHKWVDFAEAGYGVALLNNCKYGHDLKNNVMRLTLLKSSNYPDEHADQGMHAFTYALLPHTGEWYQAGVEEEAQNLNNPALLFAGSRKTTAALLQLDAAGIAVDAVKKAEDRNTVVVRMHEFYGAHSSAVLTVPNGLAWRVCNLMEHEQTEWSTAPIALQFGPYELKTIEIKGEQA